MLRRAFSFLAVLAPAAVLVIAQLAMAGPPYLWGCFRIATDDCIEVPIESSTQAAQRAECEALGDPEIDPHKWMPYNPSAVDDEGEPINACVQNFKAPFD